MILPRTQRGSPNPVLTRILVVDDYPAVCTVVVMLLENAGYVVECASSGEDALKAMTASRAAFDVLVTDLQMPPGMGGDELAQRAREHTPSLRVVLMTGEPDALPDPIDQQNIGVLHKPFRAVELVSAVCSVLRTSPVSPPITTHSQLSMLRVSK